MKKIKKMDNLVEDIKRIIDEFHCKLSNHSIISSPSLEKTKNQIAEEYQNTLSNHVKEMADKQEAKDQIIKEICAYCYLRDIEPLQISYVEWDTYFNMMYRLFKAKGIKDLFYISMSTLSKNTFDEKIINKKEITINDFIFSFEGLINGTCYIEKGTITEQEMLEISNEIVEELSSELEVAEVDNASQYVKKIKK